MLGVLSVDYRDRNTVKGPTATATLVVRGTGDDARHKFVSNFISTKSCSSHQRAVVHADNESNTQARRSISRQLFSGYKEKFTLWGCWCTRRKLISY